MWDSLVRPSAELADSFRATGLVGAYTHEVWWPKVKVWLIGAGLLRNL